MQYEKTSLKHNNLTTMPYGIVWLDVSVWLPVIPWPKVNIYAFIGSWNVEQFLVRLSSCSLINTTQLSDSREHLMFLFPYQACLTTISNIKEIKHFQILCTQIIPTPKDKMHLYMFSTCSPEFNTNDLKCPSQSFDLKLTDNLRRELKVWLIAWRPSNLIMKHA